jgi:uncharacterized repeat protein (TIGR01451 family)
VLAVGALLFGLAPTTPAYAANGVLSVSVSITDVNGTPISVVDASQIDVYRVRINFSCNVAVCDSTQVKLAGMPVDPYRGTEYKEQSFTFTPPSGITPTPAATGSIGAGFTIPLGSLSQGTGGSMSFDFNVGEHRAGVIAGNFFPDGSTINPQVTVTSTTAATASGSATATWKSYIPTPTLSLATSQSRINTDTTLTVTANLNSGCMPDYTRPYYLCGDTTRVTVDLPDKAEYVSGGTYDAGTRTVTLTGGPDAWRSAAPTFQVRFPSSSMPTTGGDCVATQTFTAHDATYTFLDDTVKPTSPATATATATVGNCAPFAKGSVRKAASILGSGEQTTYGIPATAAGAYNMNWMVFASNQSNVPAVATIVDNDLDLPDLEVHTIQTGNGAPTASIAYTLDDGTSGSVTNVATYVAPAGRHIVAATVTSPVLAPPNVQETDTGSTTFGLRYIAWVKAGATPGPRTNTASASLTFPDNPELGTYTPPTSPVSRTITLANAATPFTLTANGLTASVPGNNTPIPGTEVTWTGNGNAGNLTASTNWTPQYVFLAPRGWDIKTGSASLSTAVPGMAPPVYKTVTYDGDTYDAVIMNWPAPVTGTDTYTLPTLSVKTTPTGAAVAGSNNQTAYLFVGDAANQIADAYTFGGYSDATDFDQDGVTTDRFARNIGTSSLGQSPAIDAKKYICQPDPSATDGCNWIADPSITVGVPPAATSIKYRVTVTNTGNAPLSSVMAYDVLPYLGDTGTTDATAGTPRGSTVQEELASVINDNADVTLAYSSSTNPPRPEVYTGSTPPGDWTAPLAGASAIRASIPTLAPGESRSFIYTAALVGASADQIACNSVAAAGAGIKVEPSPVCATTQEADFSIESTDHLPLQAGRVGVVPFVVNNGGGSQSATAAMTITVPAEVEVADLAPEGWNCTAPEMTGPVEVTCHPVSADGTARSLDKDVPETVELHVRPTDAAPSDLCFDAVVEGLMNDPVSENNTAQSCTTALSAEPELLVSKDDGKTSVAVGEELTYTITASSRLVAEPIDGVSLTDTLPDSLQFVSADPVPTSQSGQTLSWDLGRLEQAGIPGGGGDLTSGGPGSSTSVTVTVRVRPGAQDSISNTAAVTGADPADSSVTLSADDTDVDAVTNVFSDLGASETTPQNTPVTTALAEIASAAGAPLDPSLVTQSAGPQHGSIAIDPSTGAVTYNPAPGYSGADSYDVQVCDTTSPTPQCFVATVDVTVGVNVVDAVDDTATTDAGVPVSTDVRSNDTTASGQSLGVPTIESGPAEGAVVVNADGSITYTPNPATSGADSYTYRVCDTSSPSPVCDTATVDVWVANVWNETGETVQTPQNTPVTTPLDEIVTTVGAPVDPSSVVQSSSPMHGSISIDAATGAVTYTPAPGYMGADFYQLQVCDEGPSECSALTVQVQVLPNVVTAVDDTASTDAPSPVSTDVRANDSSASGQAFAAPTVESGPAHGTAAVNGDGTITYAPDAGFSGTDSYTYEVCDTSTPDAVCDSATVTIDVANVFGDLGAEETTPQNTAVTTPLAEIVSVTGAAVDPASVSEKTAPAHGTTSIDSGTGAVTYTPEAGYSGSDSYEVRVCDTSTPDAQCFTATVQVTIEANVVDAVDDTATTDAGIATSTDVRSNDTTQSGQALADPTVTADPGHGEASVNGDGSITYTPGARFSGTDSYKYRVCDTSHPDPICDTATVAIEVANVFTDGPAADGNLGVETTHNTAITTPLADVVTSTGAPLDPATVAETTAPGHGAISVDPDTGAVTYTPERGYAGGDSYSVSVCDTSSPTPQCHEVTVAVTVLDNDVAAPDLAVETRTNQASEPIDVLAVTVSASGQDLDTPTVTSDPEHGTVVVNSDGTVTYTPADGYDGEDSFVYQVCDTSHPTAVCDTGAVTVAVAPVADLAVAKSLTSDELVAGRPVSYEVAVTNSGPSTAQEVHSIDPVPAVIGDPTGKPDDAVPGGQCETRAATGADLDRLDTTHGRYTVESHPNVVECTYPSIPSGTTVHETIDGTVEAALKDATTVVNQAAVFATTYDPTLEDNVSAVSTESAARADLVLTVTAGERKVSEGDVVAVTFTAENRGPSDASGVVVEETATGLKAISSDVAPRALARAADGSSAWTIGDLASGDRVVRTVKYRVSGQDVARVVGRVSAAAPTDPELDNNGGEACVSEREGCGLVTFQIVDTRDNNNNGNDNDNGSGDSNGDGDSGALADTGAPFGSGMLNVALGMIVAGAAALWFSRRRKSES